MENKTFELLRQYGRVLQQWLFPLREEELGPLTEKHAQVVRVLGLAEIEKAVGSSEGRVGRPPRDRRAIARVPPCGMAQAIYNVATTRALLDLLQMDSRWRRICGWERPSEVPDESVFSRALGEFARSRSAGCRSGYTRR